MPRPTPAAGIKKQPHVHPAEPAAYLPESAPDAPEKPVRRRSAPKAKAAAPEPAQASSEPVHPVRQTGPRKPRTKRPARPERTLPIRFSLDFPPADHAALKRWCAAAEDELQVPSVGMAVVVRLLATELLTNGALSRRIMAELDRQL